MALPKIIWTYWEQGRHEAPPLVQRCFESWEFWNPGWTLHVLDRDTLKKYTDLEQRVDFSRNDITVQKRSNLIRVSVLRSHGGVWTDSTVMCSQPLETWLSEYMSTGFFAFRNPGRDRLWSSWFIMAEPDNSLMTALEAAFVDLFASTEYTLQNTRLGDVFRRALKPFLTRNASCSRIWVSRRVRNLLKTYPYFQFHYCFNTIVLNSSDASQVWNEAKPFPARLPHTLQRLARLPDGAVEAGEFVLSQRSPVHKLSWRLDPDDAYWLGVFDCFEKLRRHNLETGSGE